MVFYVIVIVALIGLVVWFVRTPTFRQLRRGRGESSGQHRDQHDGGHNPYGGNGPAGI